MSICITSSRGVLSGTFAAFSAGARNASLTNPWALACAGARLAQKYIRALTPGG
ncbi:MAG: hypothetical protein AAF549_00780 [Pseudomonadota bacterium]